MVSKKNLSLLRKTSATEMQSLSLVNISNELETRCPLLYSVLMTAGTTGRKKSSTQSWLPGVVVAASVVLKQRCRDVNAVHLEIEHDNNSIKEGIRKLGPNLTRSAVTRTARMLPVARGVVHNVSQECSLMKRSGKHFVATTRKDLLKLVSLLMQADALRETPGRHYKHFKQFVRSAMHGLQMGKMCKWINKHKYELQTGRKAR